MQTRDYVRAALWDTAITFSPQSRAMTSPDHLDSIGMISCGGGVSKGK